MENNSERLHYAIALGLGVVGLLIILIFVSIRSQADTTTSSVVVSNTSPTVDSIGGTGASSTVVATTFTLDAETNVISNSVSTTFYEKFLYTDANGCTQVSNNATSYGFFMYKNGTSGCTATSTGDAMNCINTNSSNYTCAVSGCVAGAGDTTGVVTCSASMPYNTAANYAWTGTNYVYDGVIGVAGTNYATLAMGSMTINPTNAIKITSSTTNTAKSTVNFGTVAIGATSSVDTVAIYNVGNSTGTLSFGGNRMDCTGSNSTPIATSSIKYSTSTSVYTVSSNSLGASATLISVFQVLPTFSLAGTSYSSTTYWGLSLVGAEGAAGTCTGSVFMVKGT